MTGSAIVSSAAAAPTAAVGGRSGWGAPPATAPPRRDRPGRRVLRLRAIDPAAPVEGLRPRSTPGPIPVCAPLAPSTPDLPGTTGAPPAAPQVWHDAPLSQVLRACFADPSGAGAPAAGLPWPADGRLLLVDSDLDRLRLLELHRAVVISQPAGRWATWWHGDPRHWLEELSTTGAMSPAAVDYWRCQRRRLARGLNRGTLPGSDRGWRNRRLLAALLLPGRPIARLLSIDDRIRRSGRFLDVWGRRRWRSAIGLRLAAAVLRLTNPEGRADNWPAALRLARNWRGRLTTWLLACDPATDERLRRWWGLAMKSPATDRGGVPVAGPDPESIERIRCRWAGVTLLSRANVGARGRLKDDLWHALTTA